MRQLCSEQERLALQRRELTYIDPYPEIETYHRNPLLSYLDALNLDYLIRRKTVTKRIADADQAREYAETVKRTFRQCIGPLPEDRRVRAIVTGTIDKGTYLIDRVVIESVPDVGITANFYYPKGSSGPHPAVLMMCGHAPEGKANPVYVSFCVEAVANGFCVLIFDPIGQGERRIAAACEDGRPTALDPVAAHVLVDQKLSLLGEHAGQWMMWDNIKALDYLLSRPEVDSSRIAATGNSGGGTMSAYMGAFDDRIRVVAPSCYITELRALLHRLLAQDAEQCVPGFMAHGLDHSDLIAAAAPKPYFIGSALFDFFPIDGVRDAYIEAKRLYRLLGRADNLAIYTAPYGHGFWHDIRAKALEFMCRHLDVPYTADKPIDYNDLPTERELRCGAEADPVPCLERGILHWIASRTDEPRRDAAAQEVTLRNRLLKVLRLDAGTDIPASEIREADSPLPGYTAAAVNLWPEPGMRIFAELLVKEGGSKDTVLIHVGERDEGFRPPEEFRNGALLFVEPRGTGKGRVDPRSSFGMFDVETAVGYNLRMLDRTLQGGRVADAAAAVRLIRAMPEYEGAKLAICGKEEHALTALYAAVVEDVRHVYLEGLPVSFRPFLASPSHRWGPSVFVSGLLNEFDIGDVLAALLPGEIVIRGLLDPMKRPADPDAARGLLGTALKEAEARTGCAVRWIP
jgi:hypothetical protein